MTQAARHAPCPSPAAARTDASAPDADARRRVGASETAKKRRPTGRRGQDRLCVGLLGVEGFLGNLGEIGKRRVILEGELGEHLAVERDACELQTMHERAVG